MEGRCLARLQAQMANGVSGNTQTPCDKKKRSASVATSPDISMDVGTGSNRQPMQNMWPSYKHARGHTSTDAMPMVSPQQFMVGAQLQASAHEDQRANRERLHAWNLAYGMN